MSLLSLKTNEKPSPIVVCLYVLFAGGRNYLVIKRWNRTTNQVSRAASTNQSSCLTKTQMRKKRKGAETHGKRDVISVATQFQVDVDIVRIY